MTKQITVLGKTFSSEEERRACFREELRKKLPELRQMEGFPIGEDEDIINLSDPPYYTACPNPWLNDFINEWEAEKKELERIGERNVNSKVDQPFASDVSEGKNNPIYNAHSYHTKVPHAAIMRYLMHYTQPGDIVFDGFAGTGMTGVAARLCENPPLELKHKIELDSTSKFSRWGHRNAIVGDLSSIASFISYNYNSPLDPSVFEEHANLILNKVEKSWKWLYETNHTNGKIGKINYVIWSEVFTCAECSHEIVFWDAAYDQDNDRILNEFNCPGCGTNLNKRTINKLMVSSYDRLTSNVVKQPKSVPVLINYSFGQKRFQKKPDTMDLDLIDRITHLDVDEWIPKQPMLNVGDMWGDTWRAGVHAGITHVHHFHTKRNLIALASFWNEADNSRLGFAELLAASAANLNCSKLRRFRTGKKGGGPLAGTLYLSSIITPQNVFSSIRRNIQFVKKALVILSMCRRNNVSIYTGSATEINLPNDSVDYVFTDPPFGANIMYSELNFLWETWLNVLTNRRKEAIESKSQNKDSLAYTELMRQSFKEKNRILKPGKWMTVVFSNTNASIWNSIQTSIQSSGFIIANVSSLDKKQGSFKAVTTSTAVKQDLVISCYKPSSEFDDKFRRHQYSKIGVWDFVEEHLNHLPIHLVKENATTAIIERSPKILFDRLIAFYVQKSLPVPIDAGAFQKGLRERFIERDGMFFTHEQVQEYDKKKSEHPEFIQLSLLVSSEQDGVLWLKNLLADTPMKYQDINPEWMQAIAGVRKGDVLPELATILEENFLEDAGRWYAPDPENEADLEKLRTKRLLRQFDEYKQQAFKPKGKIKEARVEALRAGFKQCYQDKDFRSIVRIGDRIPNNLLMEDEVLLQFYDIASSKV